MDGLYIIENLLKTVKQRREVVVEAITEGSVQDFAAYRHLRGKLEGWDEIQTELRSLLKRMDIDQDE
jgi:hypothetical protein